MSVDTLDHTAPRSPDRRERGLTHLGSPPRVSYVTGPAERVDESGGNRLCLDVRGASRSVSDGAKVQR
jgi:hypothetical protein